MPAYGKTLRLAVLSLALMGCSSLTPQAPAPLISDEAAGSTEIYLTSDSDIQAALERIAALVLDIISEEGVAAAVTTDRMNVDVRDIVFIRGSRGVLDIGMPGDGTASMRSEDDNVYLAMTGNVMACWGMKVSADGQLARTSVFAPACKAEDLAESEWYEEWPERPEPISTPDGIQFGTPAPGAR